MSYPQPKSSSAVIGGLDYFRLKTLLTTPGDIYESQESGHAFALGPDSDIARVGVMYYDDTTVNKMGSLVVSPQRSFTGLLASRNNEATYVPSNRPGRTLFYSADLYDPSYLPIGYVGGADRMMRITPTLDVIQYFTPQDSLVPQRADKQYDIPQFATGGIQWVIIPYYGRSYAQIAITNKSGGNIEFGVKGVNFSIGPAPAAASPVVATQHQETIIHTSAMIANNAQVIVTIDASPALDPTSGDRTAGGMFDALVISLSGIAGLAVAPLKIIVSDTPK